MAAVCVGESSDSSSDSNNIPNNNADDDSDSDATLSACSSIVDSGSCSLGGVAPRSPAPNMAGVRRVTRSSRVTSREVRARERGRGGREKGRGEKVVVMGPGRKSLRCSGVNSSKTLSI